ncbi:hypothetical protein BCR39DRAFT_518618 [Naematelia encephala]|uniref:NADH-ubiquinone oxidoreductase 21.3 kDa subunit n=1 Tax=Naematelia encephala TaxID=71784 RepID=A0A1Y2BHU4_9TREE|nr:hypothetical protein BCR39DRAFT_518618 [Naematelia encephala]
MVRLSGVIRNAAKSAQAAGKTEPMSADSTLYHLSPTGFWKKFRDAVVVNPEISSGLPVPLLNRYPQPGSRPEKYATPATQASDPAFNPYHKRDVRRAYPQTSYITQSHLSSLLLASPSLASLPAPETATKVPADSSSIAPNAEGSEQAIVTSSVPSLASVLEKLPVGQAFVGAGLDTGKAQAGALPPAPPGLGKKWIPKAGEDIPHDPDAYFPMVGYS